RFWVEGDPPNALIDVYELVDRTMGRIMKAHVRDEDTVLMVSDHGSWPVHHLVHIAPLLAEGGFLTRGRPRDDGPSPSDQVKMGRGVGDKDKRRKGFFKRMDWERTKAFPLGDSVIATGIYVNRPPFPNPAVPPDEYEDVRTEVTKFLSGVEGPDDGEPVFGTVARSEDVYRGGAVGLAPDIIVDGIPGFSPHLGRILNFKTLFTQVMVGGHRREGMYVVTSPLGLDEIEPIEGLLPKVLRGLDFELPEAEHDEGLLDAGYTAEQAEEIERRLQGLGYME
ncbi:MAG TPA: alkaline phosphatase family protein, partial [Actinomycetota bacterium]|nr:alkaline phosphatase family protein [Actinomycetota bacterium]